MAKRVLAVDDNEDLLSLLRDLFRDEGYDYVACSKPRDAYQTARMSHPDLVLLDVVMPAMNGWEVLNLFVLDPQIATSADRTDDVGGGRCGAPVGQTQCA